MKKRRNSLINLNIINNIRQPNLGANSNVHKPNLKSDQIGIPDLIQRVHPGPVLRSIGRILRPCKPVVQHIRFASILPITLCLDEAAKARVTSGLLIDAPDSEALKIEDHLPWDVGDGTETGSDLHISGLIVGDYGVTAAVGVEALGAWADGSVAGWATALRNVNSRAPRQENGATCT